MVYMAYAAMSHDLVSMAYVAMACVVMASVGQAALVLPASLYDGFKVVVIILMRCIGIACNIMAFTGLAYIPYGLCSRGLHCYGLCSYGYHTYGVCSHGLHTYVVMA